MIIDISSYQGIVDWLTFSEWNAKQSDPVKGVYIKASQGVNGQDKLALINARGAAKIGLPIGYYHFATLNKADVVADALSEASDFQAQLRNLPAAQLPPAIDIETDELSLDPFQVLLWVQTWRKNLTNSIIYSGPYFLNQHLPPGHGLGSMGLWVAHYGTEHPLIPNGWSTYYLHQYTDKGVIGGIKGNVDLSRTK